MAVDRKLNKQVNALARGIAILRYLEWQDQPVSVTQAARDLGINTSTCFNLLRTLVHEQLATFDPQSKKYSPSLGILALGRGALKHHGYIQLLHPRLQRVANMHKVTVMLWQLLSTDRAMVVDLAETPSPLRVQFTVGQRLPSLIGALGRCFAAYLNLPKTRLEAMFQELKWQNPPSFEEYWADVKEARCNGFAIDIGRYNRNFTTAAAPILTHESQSAMAVSAIAFSSDIDQSRLLRLAEELKQMTMEASNALGTVETPEIPEPAITGQSET